MGQVPDSAAVSRDGLRPTLVQQVLGGVQPVPDDAPAPDPQPWVLHAEFDRHHDRDGNPRYLAATGCTGRLRFVEQGGPVWTATCDLCGFEVGVPIERVDPKLAVGRKIEKAGIPPAFAGKSFNDDQPINDDALAACRTWIQQFGDDRMPAPFLWGKTGRGKSHLLSMICVGLIRKYGVDVIYRSASEMFDELKAGMDEGSYELRWQRVLSVPVLALDDVGAGHWSDWRLDRIAALVDHRYTKALPVIVATNLEPAVLYDELGDRTASRLAGMTFKLELGGPDRRAQGEQQTLAEPSR